MNRLWMILIFTASSMIANAQTSRAGLLPELILSKKLSDQWQITGQLESMNQFFEKRQDFDLTRAYDYRRTDLTLIGSYRLNPSIKLSTGLLNRYAKGEHILRSLQQVSLSSRGASIRFGHRLRTDQTYHSQMTTHRIRYRVSIELPLKGKNLNNKEWYLKTSLEHLTIIESKNVNMEQRINLAFGNLISEGQRIEIGWDYRTRTLIDWNDRYQLWLMINYYVSLN